MDSTEISLTNDTLKRSSFSIPDPLVLPKRLRGKIQNVAHELDFIGPDFNPTSTSFSKDFSQPSEPVFTYACRNWCYHLKEILIFHDGMSYLMFYLEDEILRTLFISCLSFLATDWFQTWGRSLGRQLARWKGLKDELDTIVSMCPDPSSHIIFSPLHEIQKQIEKELILCRLKERTLIFLGLR